MARLNFYWTALLALLLHSALGECGAKHREFTAHCDGLTDKAMCEEQFVCFWVEEKACNGDLSALNGLDYGVDRVRFFLPKCTTSKCFFQSIINRAAEFTACTGVQIDFMERDSLMKAWGTLNDMVNSDLGKENCDLSSQTCSVQQGIGRYDAYLVKHGWVGSYADAGLLEDFKSYILGGPPGLAWYDNVPGLRDLMCKYGDEVVAWPLDADFSQLVVRDDALSIYKKETGKDIQAMGGFQTWDDLADFLRQMDGHDFDGDGEADLASCVQRCGDGDLGYFELGGLFYMVYAGLIQTLGARQGIHFDAETMRPIFDNEGFAEALRVYRDISVPCPVSSETSCAKKLKMSAEYGAGKCVMFMSHPGVINAQVIGQSVGRKNATGHFIWQPRMPDGLTYAMARRFRIPGWKKVVDRLTKKLVDCNEESCPLAEKDFKINRSPVVVGGNTIIIRRAASNATKRAVKDFLNYMTAPTQSLPDTASPGTWNNHWRSSHIAAVARDTHKIFGWSDKAFDDLVHVTNDMSTPNPSGELRLRGYTQYIYDVGEVAMMKHFGYVEDKHACLHEAIGLEDPSNLAKHLTQGWEAITEGFGRLSQLIRYRRSLALPALDATTLCVDWRDQLSDSEKLKCVLPCEKGSFYDTVTGECDHCPVGKYTGAVGQTQCTICPAGSNCIEGTGLPPPCPIGTFSKSGAGICSECPPGTLSNNPLGAAECKVCDPGHFAAGRGAIKCIACPVGKFADSTSSSMCKECQSMTTGTVGVSSSAGCVCKSGGYFDVATDACEPCPVGMTCEGPPEAPLAMTPLPGDAHRPPRVPPGFMALGEDTYRCTGIETCPGAWMGSSTETMCGSVGSYIACAKCPDGYAFDGFKCSECEAWAGLLASVLLLVAIMVTVGAFLASAKQLNTVSEIQLSSFNVLTLLLVFVQLLAACNELGLDWGNPFKLLMDALSVFSIDIELLQLNCAVTSQPDALYAIKMAVPMVAIASIFVAFLVAKDLLSRPVQIKNVFNAIGQVFITFLITIGLGTLTPFKCYLHPTGARSLDAHPHVLCWNDEAHTSMVVVALVGVLLYIVSTVAIVIWAVHAYPLQIIKDDTWFVECFRFLFLRWKPSHYWFGLVYIFRNVVVALLPMIVPVELNTLALVLVEDVLLIALCATSYYCPWRETLSSHLDIFLGIVLLVCLHVGAVTQGGGTLGFAPSLLLTIVVLGSFVLLLGCGLLKLFQATFQSKRFSVFLSHHKGGGACAARFLKLCLDIILSGKVFFDSDNLANFDGIFGGVQASKDVIVILSGETLCRPWCIGEIVTAHQWNIPMHTLQLGNASAPDKWLTLTIEERAQLFGRFEVLRPYGIAMEHIEPAIEHMLKSNIIAVDMFLSTSLDAGFVELSSRLTSKTIGSTTFASKEESTAQAVISVDPSDQEAAASSRVLKIMIQQMTQVNVALDFTVSIEAMIDESQFVVMIWLITGSSLQNPQQLTRLAVMHHSCVTIIPVIVGESFPFPEESYYADLVAGNNHSILEAAIHSKVSMDEVATAVRSAFKEIAVFVNIAYASKSMLDVSVGTLASRIKSGIGAAPTPADFLRSQSSLAIDKPKFDKEAGTPKINFFV